MATRRASARALATSADQTLPDRPNGESLAMRSASSPLPTRITGKRGPKVSSRMTAISGVASAINVGGKNWPPPRSVRRAPPVSTRAPRATASAI